jgi:CBS-domain-containing membrane protein
VESTVKDVMTRSVAAVRATAGYKDIVTVMGQRRISAFPVLDAADRVVGVVSEADLLFKEVGPEPFTGPEASMQASGRRGERAKAAGVTAGELMSQPAVTIGPDASLAEAARTMYARRVKRLPVVDENGRLIGIVSRVDILHIFARPDEQIREDVIRKVVTGEFAIDPNAVKVAVASGIVTITGEAENQDLALHLLETVQHVEGVVDVRDRLDYSS